MSTEFFNDQWRIPSNENQNKISNYSMDFDGTNDKIEFGNVNNFERTDAFSGSCWVFSRGSLVNQYIISKFDSSNNKGYQFYINSAGALVFIIGPGPGSTIMQAVASTQPSTNTWNHLVFTYDGSSTNTGIKIYINGILQTLSFLGDASITGTIVDSSTPFQICGRTGTTANGVNGKIDQTTIFDYALSQDQVKILGGEGYVFNFIPNDYIECGDITILNNLNAFSTSTWINCNSVSGSPVVLAGGNSSTNRFYIQLVNSTTLRYVSGSDVKDVTISNIIDGNFHHIATVQDGTSLDVYLDNFKTSFTVTGVSSNVGDSFTIGAYFTRASNFFNGELSNTTVFNNGLTVAQVQTLYNSGKPLSDMSGFTSLQGWWKLDENAIFNSTSTEWSVDNNSVPSTYKSSLDFDGSSDLVNISSATATTFNNLSFSGWLNWDNTQYSCPFAFSTLGGADTSTGFAIEVREPNNGRIRVAIQGSGWLVSTAVIPRDTWFHIAVTMSPTGIIMYKDGEEILNSTATNSLNRQPVYESAAIGVRSYLSLSPPLAQYFGGTLSNIALWNTTLTGPQVTTLYNNGTPEASISHSPLSWWKLNNTTTGIQDSAGSNNGTNNGATKYDGFVNALAGDSVGMDASNLVTSNIDGELISNPMALSPKPISYYQLGDQSVDNGANYLVPNNSLSDYVFDWFSGANGTLIQVPSTSNFAFGSGGFGVSLWINFNSVNVAYNILDFRANGAAAAVGSLWFDPALGVRWYVAPGYKSANIPASSFSINTWYNIVVVNNGSTIYFYLNENLVDSTTDTTVYIAAPLTIGAYSGGANTAALSGKLSNISIFNTALLTADIQTIYNNGSPNDISSLSPVAWYKLNSSEIFNNTSTEWSIDNNAYPSVYNSSLNFDSDSVNCGNTLGSGYSSISVSSWVNFDNPNANLREEIISKDDGSSNRSFALFKNKNSDWATYGTVGLLVNDGTTTSNATVSQADFTPSANTWYNVIGTWDGANIKLYINGVLKKTTAFSASNLDTNTVNVLIGDSSASGTYFLNGQISNTAVWNTALTLPQVVTLYNNGQPASDISSLSPVSWWKLDNTTTGLLDSGSASNNGTNSGATEYAGFVNALAGESSGMDSSNLVVSDLQQTSGYSPYALDFGGITGSLRTYTIPAATNTVTLSAWVKRTGAAGQYAGVFGVRNSGGTPSFGLCWQIAFGNNDNKIRFRTSADVSSAYQEVVQNDVMPDDTWHHVAGVADGTNLKIYINGVLQTDTKTQTNGTLQSPFSNIFFAAQGPSHGNPFNGQLSNCARWNIGLTQAQVTEIYNQGVPSNLNNFSGTAPIGWWQIGSNSSFEGNDWTCLDEIGTDYADSGTTAMSNDDIVDGPGYSANGLGTSSIEIVGDAPYSTANGLSENMDVLDRVRDTPINLQPITNTHSIQLDGIDGYVDFGDSDDLSFGSASGDLPFSISGWVKPADIGATFKFRFIRKAPFSNSNGWEYIIGTNGSGLLNFLIYGNNSSTRIGKSPSVAITSTAWQHWAFTYDGTGSTTGTNSGMKIYVNGVEASSYVDSNNGTYTGMTNGSAPLSYGIAWGSSGLDYAEGLIDEVAIFNVELTGPQVAAIYNGGTPNNILPLSPVLWSRFESLTTNAGVVTTADSSGNGLTGTVINGAVLSTSVP